MKICNVTFNRSSKKEKNIIIGYFLGFFFFFGFSLLACQFVFFSSGKGLVGGVNVRSWIVEFDKNYDLHEKWNEQLKSDGWLCKDKCIHSLLMHIFYPIVLFQL